MKILFVITGLFPGGAEKIVLETIRNLRKQGHDAAAVSLQPEPDAKQHAIVSELQSLGVRLYFLNLSLRHPFRFFLLNRIIRKEKPDVVHSHLMHANLLTRAARLFRRFTLINTIHIAERRSCLKVRLLFLLDRWSSQLCDISTAVSAEAAHFHEQQCRLPEHSIRVVMNGSDPVEPAAPEKQKQLLHEWGLENVQKRIGSIGRLDFQKGYDLFLNSLPALRPLIPSGERWGIILIGDGTERKKLQILAERMEREIPELRIVLPGYRPDAAALLPMLDLFVMPSRYEGFGLALTEALSAGLPCLCSRADSLPGLCARSPENTLCTDFVCGKEMTEVYRRALRLPHLRGKILRTAEQMTADYLAIYREAVSQTS